MLVFYPRDVSFVCPTELTAFSARLDEFRRRDCEILGVSVDPIESHRQWLTTPESEGGLGQLQFPLAADPDGKMSQSFGVWVPDKKVSTRGLFLIDPTGDLQYTVVHNLSVGRSADEILRVLDALRAGGLCPAGWTSADGTLDVERALQPGRVLFDLKLLPALAQLAAQLPGAAASARDPLPEAVELLGPGELSPAASPEQALLELRFAPESLALARVAGAGHARRRGIDRQCQGNAVAGAGPVVRADLDVRRSGKRTVW